MSNATENSVLRERASAYEAIAGATVGVSALLFAVSLAAIAGFVSVTDPIGGVTTLTLLGVLISLVGAAVVGFGIASRLNVAPTEPRRSAGIVPAVCFAGLWFSVAGLLASQTFGLGTASWLAAASLVGAGTFAFVAVTPEDVGSTLPAGAFAALAGLAILSGAIDASWAWSPNFPSQKPVTFFADVVAPAAAMLSALLASWAAGKAYGGFGARGRHVSAHLLLYLNATAILAVLGVLVVFTVFKGIPGAFRGAAFGAGVGPSTTIAFTATVPVADVTLFAIRDTVVWPVSVPFVMQGVSLFNEANGVLPGIAGTAWLVLGAMVFAVPLGVGSAVFLTEYAERGRFVQVVEVATNGLWSTPSIVFGLFGYTFLIGRISPGKSLLVGQLTLGFMLLPLVIITSREAMLAVPDGYRDASAALGVSKWATIRSVVVPAALPGIVTGVILGVGRIAGETAPILLTMVGDPFPNAGGAVDVFGGFQFVGAPPFVAYDTEVLMTATTALPYQLYAVIRAGVGTSSNIQNLDQFGWATAFVLLVVVLAFYAVGIATRYYFRRKLSHE